ncbi:hypothetical protein Salat_0498300 [Sesamum alatum]|uniref:Uncharacterized protein n=1 Tax=Sesamum alatum TaxID=300844 RepID=A0AAE2D1D0_9LAMI|nr:hypothetical protein Salat_0498300 [Sesamum alatum]
MLRVHQWLRVLMWQGVVKGLRVVMWQGVVKGLKVGLVMDHNKDGDHHVQHSGPRQGLENHNILPPIHEDTNEGDEVFDGVITQVHTQEEPIYRPGPSMYQQMTISNQQTTLQPRLQIRAPPPMVGNQVFQRFNPPRMSSQNVNAIIKE